MHGRCVRLSCETSRELMSVSQSVSVFVIQAVLGTPGTLSKASSPVSWRKETLSFHARRRATLAIPIRHRDNLIAKEGRLYNTEPNLAVYF